MIPEHYETWLGKYDLVRVYTQPVGIFWSEPVECVEYNYTTTRIQVGRGGYTYPMAQVGEVWEKCGCRLDKWISEANYWNGVANES
jgi:hypothetical protein